MKAIVKITLVLLSSLTISCQGWLDVEPKTEVKSDVMFESESGFKDPDEQVFHVWTGTHNGFSGRDRPAI